MKNFEPIKYERQVFAPGELGKLSDYTVTPSGEITGPESWQTEVAELQKFFDFVTMPKKIEVDKYLPHKHIGCPLTEFVADHIAVIIQLAGRPQQREYIESLEQFRDLVEFINAPETDKALTDLNNQLEAMGVRLSFGKKIRFNKSKK